MRRLAITAALFLGLGTAAALALLLHLGSGLTVTQAQGPDSIDTYYVAPGGSCGTGISPCYATVQEAVDAADDPGDVIKVASGTYRDVHDRDTAIQVVYISKTVTVRGGYTTTDWITSYPVTQPTTLDAQQQGRVVYVSGAVNPTLDGLRITGGYLPMDGIITSGGGIYVDAAWITIRNCEIVSNSVGYFGGGISLGVCQHVLLSGNRIVSNTSSYHGGGVYASDSDVTLIGNTIVSNTTVYHGGGLGLSDCDVDLTGNHIANNEAQQGSGLSAQTCRATLTGNHISANTGDGLWLGPGTYTLISNTVFANEGNGISTGGTRLALDGNRVIGNAGSGLALLGSNVTGMNNIIADNQGNGLYVASSCSLLHSTIARNGGEGGSGVHVSGVDLDVVLTNTILVSHTVGITADPGSTPEMWATLWGGGDWANGTDWGGDGSIVTGTVNVWDDPVFLDPDGGDYHIGAASAARDAGVDAGITDVIDGDPRPMGHGYDLGADEFRVALAVGKRVESGTVQAGGQLTFTLCATNTGDVDLHATITDTLSDHMTAAGPLTWTPTLAPDEMWEETVVVTVETGYSGVLTNIVQVTTEEGAAGDDTATCTSMRDYSVYLPVVLRQYP